MSGIHRRQNREVRVCRLKGGAVMPGAGCDHQVGSRHCNASRPRPLSQIVSLSPNRFVYRELRKCAREFLENLLFPPPRAPFHSSSCTKGHQHACPPVRAASTRPRTAGSPFGRSMCIQLDVSIRITGQLPRRWAWSSSDVIRSSHVPACLISSAMRMRRLKSAMAPTTASRLVFAFVNRIASSSSRSGISIVVFMREHLAELSSADNTASIILGLAPAS